MTMISFDIGNTRFNYRVAGIALHQERILLNQLSGGDYWFLPGGRVEIGEPSDQALQREMLEEIEVEVSIGPLVWVAESLFTHANERSFHELGFYYLMDFPPDSPIYQLAGPLSTMDGHTRLNFQWFPLAELDQITLYPLFLARGLLNLPEHVVHIFDQER